METTIFQAHPEIIQIVFEVLDSPTLLNCRLVCKNWNQFLETPNFWLKKLKEIGQPEKVETKWKTLIAKSEGSEVEKSVFAKCLRMKFQDIIKYQGKSESHKKYSMKTVIIIQGNYVQSTLPVDIYETQHLSCVNSPYQ